MKNAVFLDVSPCGSLRIDVSEEHVKSIIRVERIGELGTLAGDILSEASVLTRATRRHIPEESILHSY
jgi:hypothetical protein